jgi:aspartate racemase
MTRCENGILVRACYRPEPMKLVGLVGGIGPESTVDYYRRILAECQRRHPGTAPHLVIHSISAPVLLDYAEHDRAQLTRYLLDAVHVLHKAGADVAAFCSNTPHLVFDALTRESPLPLVGMVEAVVAAAEAQRFRKVGLLGTGFTMKADFYPRAFAARGLELITPGEPDQAVIHAKYVGELARGTFRPDTREQFIEIITRMAGDHQLDALVLGGTEIPILLESYASPPVPLMNTAAIHVAAIVEGM